MPHERRRVPSLAVVLSGQVRTFTSHRVGHSIRKNLIDALCPSDRACAVELFMCAELGICTSMRTRLGSMGSPSPIVTVDELRNAWSAAFGNLSVGHITWPPTNGTFCHAASQLRCTPDEQRWCNGTRSQCDGVTDPRLTAWAETPKGARHAGRIKQLEAAARSGETFEPPAPLLGQLRWLQCFQHVLAREARRHEGRFDWLVVTRFDVGFFFPLPPLHEYMRRPGVHVPSNHYSPLCDIFALMARSAADAYFSSIAQLCCLSCLWRAPLAPWFARRQVGCQRLSFRSARPLTPAFRACIPSAPVCTHFICAIQHGCCVCDSRQKICYPWIRKRCSRHSCTRMPCQSTAASCHLLLSAGAPPLVQVRKSTQPSVHGTSSATPPHPRSTTSVRAWGGRLARLIV